MVNISVINALIRDISKKMDTLGKCEAKIKKYVLVS